MPRQDLDQAIRQLGGIATRAQLTERGFSPYRLSAAVHTGEILRIRRSRYAPADTRPEVRSAVMAGGRLGALSAAESYGWWTGTDERLHISWPTHGNVAKPGRVSFATSRSETVHHWRTDRSPSDESLWREPPLETLAQVLLSADRETAVACVDSAIHSGLVTDADARQLMQSLPKRIAQWECYIDGRSDSGLETIVRIWLMDRGIPFTFHALIDGVGEVDFLIGHSLILETDGAQFHDGLKDATRDAARDTAAALRGYLSVRLRYPMVMYSVDWRGRILEHLSRKDHLRSIR